MYSTDGLMNDNLIPPAARPTRADALKNRELLLETAGRLFAEHGVGAVSMSAVAQAAGVGKGTLYRHFPNKTELCHVLIDSEQRDLQNRTLERLRQQPDNPLGNLRWFLEQVVYFVDRHLELLFSGVISAPLMLDHPAHLWWRQTIRGLLAALRPSLDLDYAADMLYIMLDARTIYYQRTVRHYDAERIIAGLHDIVDHLVS